MYHSATLQNERRCFHFARCRMSHSKLIPDRFSKLQNVVKKKYFPLFRIHRPLSWVRQRVRHGPRQISSIAQHNNSKPHKINKVYFRQFTAIHMPFEMARCISTIHCGIAWLGLLRTYYCWHSDQPSYPLQCICAYVLPSEVLKDCNTCHLKAPEYGLRIRALANGIYCVPLKLQKERLDSRENTI